MVLFLSSCLEVMTKYSVLCCSCVICPVTSILWIFCVSLIVPSCPHPSTFQSVLHLLSFFGGGLCCCSAQSLSHLQLFGTPWTVNHQAPLSMEFSRQGYWSRSPFPTPGGLPNPGVKPMSLVSPALAGRFFTTAPTGKTFSLWLPFFWYMPVQIHFGVREINT